MEFLLFFSYKIQYRPLKIERSFNNEKRNFYENEAK
jgi:hypothetical protein